MTEKSTLPARDSTQSEQSFPLISIFQLFTFSVALVICVDFKACAKLLNETLSTSPESVFGVIAVAKSLGFAIGVMIGLGQIRKWQSMMLCGTVGAIVGVIIVAIYSAPAEPAKAIAATVLPLATTIMLRFRTP